MNDRCADLALHVVARDRQLVFLELLRPTVGRGYEFGDAVDESASCIYCCLCVESCSLLAADGQVVYENFGARILELCGHIHGLGSRFAVDVKGLFHVWRYTIEYRTRLDRNIHVRD